MKSYTMTNKNVASSAALTQNNEPPFAEPRTVSRLASNILRQTYFRMQVFVVVFLVLGAAGRLQGTNFFAEIRLLWLMRMMRLHSRV